MITGILRALAGRLALGLVLILQAPLLMAEDAATSDVVVRPADNGAALVNPGMGWTFAFYSNMLENYGSRLAPADTLDDWPGLSVVYLRVPWAYVEPKEGEFNWALLDTPAQRWIAKGKKIALRVTCSESWLRYATPKWVQDAGAKGVDFEFGHGPKPGGPLWDPDFLDPVFLQKLEHFLAAMARRYDGDPNVAFVDIGSFGMWGEGHTGFSSQLNETQTLTACKRHVDLYLKYFKNTLLCINDDMAGPTRPGRHFPITDYALARGVSLRDDSILVQPPPHSWYHADMAQEFWPRRPVILEHEHYGGSKARGAWSGDLLLKAVEDYHASYLSIHWWPREELNENRDTIARINRRLGYRLQLVEAAWPATVKTSAGWRVRWQWRNTGVASCLPGGFPAVTLKDEQGGIAGVFADEVFDARDLPVAAPGQAEARPEVAAFALPVNLKPGAYSVWISVGTRIGTPKIALPLDGDDGQRRYRLGNLTVAPP